MSNFGFLKEPFLDWLKEKKKDIEEFQNFNLVQNAKEILDYNDIDISELDENLQNLDCLPPNAMDLLLKRFVNYYKNFISKDAPVLFKVNFEINNLPNSYQNRWEELQSKKSTYTGSKIDLLYVSAVEKEDITNELKQKFYNQCHYCGKPNEFEHISGNKKFNKKVRFCHSYDCENLNKTDGSNPLEHENCCFGKYAQAKKKLYQQMKAIKVTKEEKIKKFIEYCENRLEECHNIKWTVQTDKTPAKNEIEWFD